jgi:hypothetical protein
MRDVVLSVPVNRAARIARWRGVALMPAAVVAVHQLRYWLTYGPGATGELAHTGHSYLTAVTPWVVMLVAVAAGAFLGRLARARASGCDSGERAGLLRVWLGGSVALVAIYAFQELLEGLLATGHPAGVAGILGAGGWWSIPAALVVAGALALLLRGADGLVEACARRHSGRARVPQTAARSRRRPVDWQRRRTAPLALARAGRAPPAVIVTS